MSRLGQAGPVCYCTTQAHPYTHQLSERKVRDVEWYVMYFYNLTVSSSFSVSTILQAIPLGRLSSPPALQLKPPPSEPPSLSPGAGIENMLKRHKLMSVTIYQYSSLQSNDQRMSSMAKTFEEMPNPLGFPSAAGRPIQLFWCVCFPLGYLGPLFLHYSYYSYTIPDMKDDPRRDSSKTPLRAASCFWPSIVCRSRQQTGGTVVIWASTTPRPMPTTGKSTSRPRSRPRQRPRPTPRSPRPFDRGL